MDRPMDGPVVDLLLACWTLWSVVDLYVDLLWSTGQMSAPSVDGWMGGRPDGWDLLLVGELVGGWLDGWSAGRPVGLVGWLASGQVGQSVGSHARASCPFTHIADTIFEWMREHARDSCRRLPFMVQLVDALVEKRMMQCPVRRVKPHLNDEPMQNEVYSRPAGECGWSAIFGVECITFCTAHLPRLKLSVRVVSGEPPRRTPERCRCHAGSVANQEKRKRFTMTTETVCSHSEAVK